MRLCVVSDSHRHRHELLTAVKNLQPIDAILHAGDETSDAMWLRERVDWPIYSVSGNWDVVSDISPLEQTLEFAGLRVYLTHGHKYRVKEGIALLSQKAEEQNAQLVVFGHTHKSMADFLDGRIYVNPGSLASPRGRRERTCALIEIQPAEELQYRQVRVSHMTVQGEITNVVLSAVLRS